MGNSTLKNNEVSSNCIYAEEPPGTLLLPLMKWFITDYIYVHSLDKHYMVNIISLEDMDILIFNTLLKTPFKTFSHRDNLVYLFL